MSTPLDSAVLTERNNAGDYDMRLGGWTNDMIDPDQILTYYVLPESSDHGRTGYFNQEAADLVLAAKTELDPEKRQEMYYEVQRIYAEDGMLFYLFNIPYIDVLAANIKRDPNPSLQRSPLVGKPAPAFTLAPVGGGAPVSLESLRGRPVVINFWATWCAPCRREIPMLSAINKERAAENIEVLGIAVDFRDDVVAYADKIGLDYALLIGEQEGLDTMAKFGLSSAGFPFTIFTDNQGRIVTGHMGELHAAEAKVILDAVTRLNSGRVTMEQAREEITTGLEQLEPESKS